MKTTIPTQAEYEANERRMLCKQLVDVESAPLADRRDARDGWALSLNVAHLNGSYIPLVVNHLLAGNYGYGAMQAAHEIARNTRMNRAAALGQLIAALEWQCPANFARQAFLKLDKAQQDKVNSAIMSEVQDWLSQQ